MFMQIHLRRGFWSLAALSFTVGLAACATHKEPPPSTEIDEGLYRNALRTLAGDDYLGRKPGSAGEDKTVAFLIESFKKIGLKPGNGESYIQTVPLIESIAAADSTLSFAGQQGVRPFSFGKDMVIWNESGAATAQLQRSDLVFVGHGIVAPEYNWNDYADIDVRGKTVLVLANDPGYASKDPTVFKGGAMTQYGRWTYKIEQAARQGAAGVLLIHDADAVSFGWDVVQNTWMGPQLHRPAAPGSSAAPAIAGWVRNEAVRDLFAGVGRDYNALVTAAAHAGFKAIPLGVKVDAQLHSAVRQFNSANVVALLTGSDKKRECLIYQAHWDSLGVDAVRQGHNVFNGAEDNASGVAGLVALAQSFQRTKPVPERSILFLATTAGVPNQLGAHYYTDNPIFPLRETEAVIALDSLLIGGTTRDVSIIGIGNSDLEDTARAAALLQGREARPEPNPQRGAYFETDSFSFASAGVPVLYVRGGLDNSARGPAWGRQLIDDYRLHRYLQPTDQYSADWDVRGALTDLSLYYEVGLRVTQARRFPRWYPNSEFRMTHSHASAD
jgi:Zn-dependent M28 family amino/carboxypeptidase